MKEILTMVNNLPDSSGTRTLDAVNHRWKGNLKKFQEKKKGKRKWKEEGVGDKGEGEEQGGQVKVKTEELFPK